ncbi:helix-turn-helix domain-containing protein [Nocardia blacklockiae]|uniref:helix-turn-helix domain-containing protein n=1 Tax=Nocardia blacklockiae TaxID=480036 RepID=UPI00189529B4|nr:helix-turn-helix transcriptional regulator [Nocardia blacklockiae]MBF6170058.1 helix-turn-helix transcriptional regulator [Nocardia blacklockiae]
MRAQHAGEAIARERKLAGLSQQQLADRLRYSASMLRAVEQGRRPASPALLAAAARILGVEPELLTGQPYRDVLDADGPLDGLSELRAILSEGEYVRGTEPGTYEELSAELAAVNDADRAGQSRRALAALPGLIRKLYGAVDLDPQPRVYALLAGAYNAADRLCRRFGHMALTVPSIDRFDWAAARSGDPLHIALGKILRTRLLMYHDSTHIALRLVDEVVGAIDGPSEGELSVRGAAHLAGAVAAARARRVDTARDHLTAARVLAARLGHETRSYETLFGPMNTEIHAIGVELEAGDPGIAARTGSELILPDSLARSRAGHHWQDVSRAWLMIGKPDQALAALNKARRVAPQQTRLHPSVRETVYGIAAAQRRRTDSLQGFAAWLGVGV